MEVALVPTSSTPHYGDTLHNQAPLRARVRGGGVDTHEYHVHAYVHIMHARVGQASDQIMIGDKSGSPLSDWLKRGRSVTLRSQNVRGLHTTEPG